MPESMCAAERLPVVPGTRYVRHARGWYMYGVRTVLAPSPPPGQAALRLQYARHKGGWYA